MWLINRQRNKAETPATLPAELLESLKALSPHSAGLQHLPASAQPRLALMPADGGLLGMAAPVAALVAADEAGKATQAQQIAELQLELQRQQVSTSVRPLSTDSTLG